MAFSEQVLIDRRQAYVASLAQENLSPVLRYQSKHGTWRDIGFVTRILDECPQANIDWMLNQLRGPARVLDVGSGLNGLAISCGYYGLNEGILSVNPSIDEKYPDTVREEATQFLTRYDGDHVRLADVIEGSLERTYPYLAQYMPFPSHSFDILFDCYGAAAYVDEDELFDYINEVYRLLDRNGKWIVVDQSGRLINGIKRETMKTWMKQVRLPNQSRDLLVYSVADSRRR